MTSLRDYWYRLNSFDWHYASSDSPAVFRGGSQEFQQLSAIAMQSDAHRILFARFQQFAWDADMLRPRRPE